MSMHTKGTWRLSENSGETWWIYETTRKDRHSHFASVKVGNFWHDEGKANARLIAAAPELLECLMNYDAKTEAEIQAVIDKATNNQKVL